MIRVYPAFAGAVLLAVPLLFGPVSAFAQSAPPIPPTDSDTTPTPPATTPPTTPVENPPGTTSQGREANPAENTPETPNPPDGLKLGVDIYYGASNRPGLHRFRDGYWLGYGTAFPSVVYGRYGGHAGDTAKVALGVGKLYNGSVPNMEQPVEAWYQHPVGKLNVTAGKFYVPFELQEWEYETKWGVMVQSSHAGFDLSGSANYNDTLHTGNFYGRAAHAFGKNATVGLSLGGGRGFSFDSSFNKGAALDATVNTGGFQLLAAYLSLRRNSFDKGFNFGFVRLSYTKWGRFTPFLSRHQWHDSSAQLGNFRSTTLGASYQLTPHLALQGAYATAPDRKVGWAQIHWTQEW